MIGESNNPSPSALPQADVARLKRIPSDEEQMRTALLAAGLTLFFVVVVALFMAFLEYQTRLASLRPGIRSNQIMALAKDDDDFHDGTIREYALLAKLKELSEKKDAALANVEYRIKLLCSLAAKLEPPAKPDPNFTKCVEFLRSVPFGGTFDPNEAARRLAAGTAWPHAAYPPDAKLQDFGKFVMSDFIKRVADNNENSLAAYLKAFNEDVVDIAKQNRIIYTGMTLEVERARKEYSEACFQNVALKSRLPYMNVETVDCLTRAGYGAAEPKAGSVEPKQGNSADVTGEGAGNASAAGVDAGAKPPAEGVSAPPPKTTLTVSSSPATSQQDRANNAQGPKTPVGQGGLGLPPDEYKPAVKADAMTETRLFELVQQLRMFNDVTFVLAETLVLTPPDYLAMWLLVFGGALGSMLKILFWHLTPSKSIRNADLLLQPAQGLVCAVILFILFRSGVVVISGNGNIGTDAAPLSPFFVAFMAIGGGLMSEQVIQSFSKAASTFIGNSAVAHPDRWAVGLKDAIAERGQKGFATTNDEIADLIEVARSRFANWVACAEPVAWHYQQKIQLVLGLPLYRIFTDIDPRPKQIDENLAGDKGGEAGNAEDKAPPEAPAPIAT